MPQLNVGEIKHSRLDQAILFIFHNSHAFPPMEAVPHVDRREFLLRDPCEWWRVGRKLQSYQLSRGALENG